MSEYLQFDETHDFPSLEARKVILLLPISQPIERKRLEKMLLRYAGVSWTRDKAIEIVEVPEFSKLKRPLRDEKLKSWRGGLQTWLSRNEFSTCIFIEGFKYPSSFENLTSKKEPRVLFPKRSDEFFGELKRALKRHELDLKSRAVRLLNKEWTLGGGVGGEEHFHKWSQQFHSKNEKKARNLLLACFDIIPTTSLVDALDLSASTRLCDSQAFFRLGGTSDHQIQGVCNRDADLPIDLVSADGNLWQEKRKAVILTDWCESGKQLYNILSGEKLGLAEREAPFARLANNSELKLEIRGAWASSLALSRLKWAQENFGFLESQLKINFPSEMIFCNVLQGVRPNFSDGTELNSVVPGYEAIGKMMVEPEEEEVLFKTIQRLIFQNWPNLGPKGILSFCSFWPFSAGEHNLALFTRKGEVHDAERGTWCPLLRNALRDREHSSGLKAKNQQ